LQAIKATEWTIRARTFKIKPIVPKIVGCPAMAFLFLAATAKKMPIIVAMMKIGARKINMSFTHINSSEPTPKTIEAIASPLLGGSGGESTKLKSSSNIMSLPFVVCES